MVDLVKLEELARWHEGQAAYAMNGLSCGSDNYEYRQAHQEADFHRDSAAALTSAKAEIERLREALNTPFPTMLRKMWSGSEVQKWLDARAAAAIGEKEPRT